jgi:anti-sigma regulatory factor (Ser/Thr protein kinase)/anti-anti-sigma regulatory factor
MTTDNNDGRSLPQNPQRPHPEAPTDRDGEPILDQAFDAGSLYALRAAVAAHATEAGLAPGRADDLVIAVHELAANAVRHGAGHGRLRIWRSDQALRCEITDDGLPHQDAAHWRSEPGHGLWLVRQVADHTSLRSGPAGTLATISVVLSPSGPDFRLDRRETDGGCTVLTVTGPLDLTSARHLTEAINTLTEDSDADDSDADDSDHGNSEGLKLVLDLTALTGWDSSGLAALITAQQRITATPNARMILAALPHHLQEHVKMAGRFTLTDTPANATKKLSEP